MQSSMLSEVLAAVPQALPEGRRFVIAVAGPPAAGKSTVAEQLRAALAPRAAVLGMDAFHFDDAVLNERGDRARKGAPHTFDVAAYGRMLTLLRDEPALDIAIPVFDRALELTRNCAEIVTPNHRVIITEGNYLLLNSAPWDELRSLFDLTVWIAPPIGAIEARISRRWLDHGFDAAQAASKAAENDLPNARLVIANSFEADVVVG